MRAFLILALAVFSVSAVAADRTITKASGVLSLTSDTFVVSVLPEFAVKHEFTGGPMEPSVGVKLMPLIAFNVLQGTVGFSMPVGDSGVSGGIEGLAGIGHSVPNTQFYLALGLDGEISKTFAADESSQYILSLGVRRAQFMGLAKGEIPDGLGYWEIPLSIGFVW